MPPRDPAKPVRVPLLSPGNWTRRSFMQALAGTAWMAGMMAVPGTRARAESSPADRTATRPRYRAVSWWLTWEDLTWPNAAAKDRVRRRADACAANGVNCCLIFGAHFRWDFLPLWGRLHELLRFIADALHQRNILLFDHHSSVLTHRPRTPDDALNIWQRNQHHVPFYPSASAAADWQFHGSRLNDWRMRDVETGEPVYLPAYNAEQYCMNHPAFRAAYAHYVKQLGAETGIDGLMSDDGIFYAGWRACGCRHCRERFQNEYGRELPPVSDAGFWGNRQSAAFRDWIEMRFRTCSDFLGEVQQALPRGFPLLTCCASSEGHGLPAHGMSYEEFIRSCDHVLLEMTGSTPTLAGTWDDRIPSQLLHLAIARDHRAPCLGLGYGFFPDPAFFIWAVNKFLGTDCWFSTLKGRLNATDAELAALADDPELVGEGFRWEQAHPQLFTGEVDTDVAVFFSRATRDFHGQIAADYVSDYRVSCQALTRAGFSCEVVTTIPVLGKIRQLVLSSATCLSKAHRRQLTAFLNAGGTVIATGPCGHYDERANPVATAWLQEFGVPVDLTEPDRPGVFPPYANIPARAEVAQCRVPESFRRSFREGWFEVAVGRGRLLWRPERIAARGVADAVGRALSSPDSPGIKVRGLPEGWRVRQYRAGPRLLIHALPGRVETVLHPSLENHFIRQRIVERVKFPRLTEALHLTSTRPLTRVTLHSPDLSQAREGRQTTDRQWVVSPEGVRRYFILECQT